ncbi:MAG: GntR family transcriptional regulator [Bacillota bacterium]|jgi:GntR family transcriptional regulator|nr:GntR family transcriptional regulator [Bacillota bacterium]NLP21677.1 GntR family transcriptional regulator [Erysipelotrichaceae bacterium]
MSIIDKNSKDPLHHQLYKIIRQKILDQEYKEGEIIPSELEMQKKYGISRITVRRTISDLEHDGLVRKIKGKGTIVEPFKSNRDLQIFQSFSGNALKKGERPGSVILENTKKEAPTKVVELLGIQPGDDIYYLKRLRLLNGRIIALNITFIRSDLGFDIEHNDFNEKTSLYDYLEKQGVKLGSANESMESRMPATDVKMDLFLEDNIPIFYKERVTFNTEGLPVEYSETSYIGNKYKYHIHLSKVREEDENV